MRHHEGITLNFAIIALGIHKLNWRNSTVFLFINFEPDLGLFIYTKSNLLPSFCEITFGCTISIPI